MHYTNALIDESSPYLLQHANNPVDWIPWSPEALVKAEKENKLLIVSIGYSACHWCHVMERESFESEEVAAVMNSHYINVKVDREERPDVDAVYMNALQLMTGQGGWPLNMVVLPDGRPVWGGTYFPKENWIDALKQIAKIKQEQPEKLEEYAARLEEGLKNTDLVQLKPLSTDFDPSLPQEAVSKWSQSFDTRQGGMRRAPKFMMPNNYQFLLRYDYHYKDPDVKRFLHTTLEQMAFGGIYDQVGGGFSRYSTDVKWHIPHFEKMLYDNAQLLSLYSQAYKSDHCSLYEETVKQTIDFLKREMLDPSGGFYAALDADSINQEGILEEGAFYVWTKKELKDLLQEDFNLFASYYNINKYGHWERGNYVLIRQDKDEDFVAEHHMDLQLLKTRKEKWKKTLLSFREKRPRPRLDDKILTGWNGLLITGLSDAYSAFGYKNYLTLALDCAEFLCTHQLREDGGLNRTFKNGKSTINGYLEDYAAVIQAFLNLYQITSDIKWLGQAEDLMKYCLEHFYNDKNGMFYFNSDEDPALIIRKVEYHDNVIPASNSIMAGNLFNLSNFLLKNEYREKAAQMLHNISGEIMQYASGFSNWLSLMLNFTQSHYQVVICGEKAEEYRDRMLNEYLPNTILAASRKPNKDLELFSGRHNDQVSLIYVCQKNTCKLSVKTPDEAIPLIEN